jgi:hypothetical protein
MRIGICLETYLKIDQTPNIFLQAYITIIFICSVMFTKDNALKTWFTVIFFLDAFSILMKFLFLIGNFFKKRFIDIISI